MLSVLSTGDKPQKRSSGLWGAVCLFTAGFICLFTSAQIAAQPQSIEIQVSQLEQNYDAHISNILASYFDQKSFIVNVVINAEMRDETTGRTTDQITRERGNISVPGLPFVPEGNIRPEQRMQTETIVRESTVRTLRILNLNITVLADTSYSDQQIEFMQLLTNIAAKTNLSRGDNVEISRIPIPGFQQDLSPEEPARSNEDSSLLANVNQYYPGLILLMIILLFIANRFQGQQGEVSHQRQHRKTRDAYKDDIGDYVRTVPKPVKQTEEPGESHNPLSEKLDEVMKQFIQSPREVALLFEYWIDDDAESGAIRAAKVIQTIDKQLLQTLTDELPAEEFILISEALAELPAMSDSEQAKTAEKFIRIFNTQNSKGDQFSKHGQLKLFRYLDHMSDEQIKKLLKGESAQTAAIALDYLPADRTANILASMNPERAADVMIQIAGVPGLHFKEYSNISSGLFSKAIELIKTEKKQKDGLDHMMPVLQRLPLNDQRRFIDQMAQTGSAIGKAAKAQVIMPEQIPDLDDAVIFSAVSHLDTQTLIHAVSGLGEEVIDSILRFRPNREQRLIRKELERGSALNPTRVVRAQLILIDSIRQKHREMKR